jgi:hypothetical protein
MRRRAGLKDVEGTIAGFWDSTLDADLHANLGADGVITWADALGAHSSTAWMMQEIELESTFGGQVGDLFPFNAALKAHTNPGMTRAVVLYPKTTFSGNSNGTGYDTVFGIPAGYALYIAVHCFTAGTTADFIIESDDNGSFTSATTRATVTLTATGSTWASVAGAVTDNHFRVRTATVTGSFSAFCAVGIRIL